VALVEHQVQDVQDGAQPARQLGVVRHAVGDPGRLDLALGPHEALGHGRFGGQEGARDLGGLEAAEQPQGQCHLGVA
jgi:hypothetical protein